MSYKRWTFRLLQPSRMKFIRSKLSNFSAHVSGVNMSIVPGEVAAWYKACWQVTPSGQPARLTVQPGPQLTVPQNHRTREPSNRPTNKPVNHLPIPQWRCAAVPRKPPSLGTDLQTDGPGVWTGPSRVGASRPNKAHSQTCAWISNTDTEHLDPDLLGSWIHPWQLADRSTEIIDPLNPLGSGVMGVVLYRPGRARALPIISKF